MDKEAQGLQFSKNTFRDNIELARAYIPFQVYTRHFHHNEALMKGTAFLSFLGLMNREDKLNKIVMGGGL